MTASIPARISASDLIDFVEKVTFHRGSSEDDLKMRIRVPGEFGPLKSAALSFKLVEEKKGGFYPTELGNTLAFSSEGERPELILNEIVMTFNFYSIPIDLIFTDKTEPFDLRTTDILKIWTTQMQVKLSKDRLNRAATTALHMFEAAGLGQYKIGRRGGVTRLEVSQFGVDAVNSNLSSLKEVKKKEIFSPNSREEGEENGSFEPENLIDVNESPDEASNEVPAVSTGYLTHISQDKSVIVKVKPSIKAVKFLELLIPIIKLEIDEAEAPVEEREEDNSIMDGHDAS